MKKHGITEIKELLDFVHLVWTFKQQKFNFWTLIFGNWKKLKRAIDEGIELWKDKTELFDEIKDLDLDEQLEINRYVKFLFGVNNDISEFIEHILKGTNEFVQAYKIAEKWRKKK